MSLLLPPILFPLFFTYSFLTLHLCGWKIILDLMKIPGTKLWNSDSVSMAWESTFSIWAFAGLQVCTSPEPSAGPVSGLVFVTDLCSAGLKTKPLRFPSFWDNAHCFKAEKKKGDDRLCKEVVSWFPLMCVRKYANDEGLLSGGKQKCISQRWLERHLLQDLPAGPVWLRGWAWT